MDKLHSGMYCEVTQEQAVELLNIEDSIHVSPDDHYIASFFDNYQQVFMRYESTMDEIVLSKFEFKDTQKIPFSDFRQRLINTVKK